MPLYRQSICKREARKTKVIALFHIPGTQFCATFGDNLVKVSNLEAGSSCTLYVKGKGLIA